MKVINYYIVGGEYYTETNDYGSISDTCVVVNGYTMPIYPLYKIKTFDDEIQFSTMIPIKSMFSNSRVETIFRTLFLWREKDAFNIALNLFNNFCNENIKTLNPKSLIKK